MLRLRAAALALVAVVAACGSHQPAELHTAAAPPAVVQLDGPRPTTTTMTTPPVTTSTTLAPPAPAVRTQAATAPVEARVGPCGGWEPTVAAHFPGEQVAKACQVMACETGGTFDPGIHNPRSTASGLWQFLDSTWRSTTGLAPPAAAYSGAQQIAAAASLWRSSGWSPWVCA